MKKDPDFIKRILSNKLITEEHFYNLLNEILSEHQLSIYKMKFDINGNVKEKTTVIAKKVNKSKQSIDQTLNVIYRKINDYCTQNKIPTNGKVKTKHELLIDSINELHRLPTFNLDTGKPEKTFSDGTDQREYFEKLKNYVYKILEKKKKGINLTPRNKQALFEYEEIKNALKQYNIDKVLSYQAEIYIQTIHKLKRMPSLKKDNSDEAEATFTNGVNQRSYYNHLIVKVNEIKEKQEKNIPLSPLEEQKLYDMKKIKEAKSQYKRKIGNSKKKISYNSLTLHQKTSELIKSINELHRLPRYVRLLKRSERLFQDGCNQTDFYNSLRTKTNIIKEKQQNGQSITEVETERLKQMALIDNVISFYPRKTFYNSLLIKALCKELNINIEINKLLLSKAYGEVYAKVCFLIENNIPISDMSGQINKIFFMSDINMQKEFNISLEEIINKYIDGKENAKESINVFRKLPK